MDPVEVARNEKVSEREAVRNAAPLYRTTPCAHPLLDVSPPTAGICAMHPLNNNYALDASGKPTWPTPKRCDPLPLDKVVFEEIPREKLDALKLAIERDETLECNAVLKHHLKDITACPCAHVTVRDKKDRDEVLGTESWCLGGRYKWSYEDDSGEDITLPASGYVYATRQAAFKCCAMFSLIETQEAEHGKGSGMALPEGAPRPPTPPTPPPCWPPNWGADLAAENAEHGEKVDVTDHTTSRLF